MLGNTSPLQVNGPPTTNTTTTTFTGGPWTAIRTHVDTSAEAIWTYRLDEDTSSLLTIENGSPTDASFLPQLRGSNSGTGLALIIQGRGTTDSGAAAIVRFDARIGSATAVVTRPAFDWTINGNSRMQFLSLNSGNNGALTWLTTTGAAPAFTTRSSGNRLILYSAISGTKVDNAIGVAASGADTWYSVQEATSSYTHKFYAGTTVAASIRGDGLLTLTGGEVHKLRVATTTPVTAAVTDFIIVTNLGTPGAVAVNLFATPTTGTVLVIKDGKGDAAANNITITPAAGNIDGAGTLVLSSNYARATLVYNGTEWNRID